MLKDIETVLFLYLSLFDACDIYIYILNFDIALSFAA